MHSPAAESDVELIQRALQKDARAVEVLVTRLHSVRGFLRRINARRGHVVHPEDLEDVAQDVYTEVLRRMAAFRGEARLESWLYRVASSHFLNHLRSEGRRRRVHHSSSGAVDDLVWTGSLELAPRIERDLTLLSDDAQRVVRMKLELDLTFEEIAQRQGRSSNTIKSVYYRALEQLREHVSHLQRLRARGARSARNPRTDVEREGLLGGQRDDSHVC